MRAHNATLVEPAQSPIGERSDRIEKSPKKEELEDARQPDAGPIPQPVSGGNANGGDVGNNGGTRDKPVRPRIIVARPELTKAGDTSLVPESVRSSLNKFQKQDVALAIDAMQKHGGFLLDGAIDRASTDTSRVAE